MLREIILDTETTGLDPLSGHRIVEIGCVEMLGGMRTGKFFHCYLNPDRDMPEEAFRVHGLSMEFLQEHPRFHEKADELLAFLGDAQLVIHNAEFDMKFINHEIGRLGHSPIPLTRAVDTVKIARQKFPGSPANLDALCKRFEIDLSSRTKHGALLDAELLAEVYIELLGGKQVTLLLETASQSAAQARTQAPRTLLAPRLFPVDAVEEEAHRAMLASLKEALWLKLEPQDAAA